VADDSGFAPSLVASFDASVRYAADNATPTSGAVGYVVDDGATTVVEGSRAVDAVVSSTALEYRALYEAVRAVDRAHDRVASLHLRGDADVVLRAVDPTDPTEPSGRVVRRRVRRTRALLADVPSVTYRAVGRERNRRAHRLATDGHS
jgi:ribonuclease HI